MTLCFPLIPMPFAPFLAVTPAEVVTLSPGNWIAVIGLGLTNLVVLGTLLWRAAATISRLEQSVQSLNTSILSLTQTTVAHNDRLHSHDIRLTRVEESVAHAHGSQPE